MAMIISHKHKFIFIHLHKCAGTSITKSLLPYLRQYHLFKKDIIMGCTPKHEILSNTSRQNGSIHKHSTAVDIKNYVGNKIWNNYFIFTFVRNPWDLVLSKYYWWHKTNAQWSPDAKKTKDKIMKMNFREFVRTIRGCYNQVMTYSLTSETKFNKSKHTSTDIEIDFIGKFENLQTDFNSICSSLKLQQIQLIRANPSFELRKGKHYRNFYDDESKEIIANVYKKDIELFNYSF